MILRNILYLVVVGFLFIARAFAALADVEKVIPGIKLDIRYATTNNFTGKKVYSSARCFLQQDAAEALKKVQRDLKKKGLALKLYDGYRPFSVQQLFWDIWVPIATKRGIMCPQRYVARPMVDIEGNPIKGSKHNRGTAIDLTLVDLKTGCEVQMPSAFDDFSDKAHRNYNTMTGEAAKNCKLLEKLMVKYGFIPEQSEWWHFNWQGWDKFPLMTATFDELDNN
jgi:D-alanyl-D-alanine dipeptidase